MQVAMEKSTNLDELCRLCGELEPQIIPVFGDEGRRQGLREKIENNVKVIVSENDDLPKGICSNCHETLSNFSNFVDQCQETQEKLQEFLTIQQTMWMVDSGADQPERTSDCEDTHDVSHTIDIPIIEPKDNVQERLLPPIIPSAVISSIEDGTLLEKSDRQTFDLQQLLQEQQVDGNSLLRLPSSTVDTTPRIVSVSSSASASSSFVSIPVKVLSPGQRPSTLGDALKGQEIAPSSQAVKVIRQIHTVDSSDLSPNGRQRKKVVFVVSKPPNVEIPSVVSAVLQSKSLPGIAPRRVATVTTGELVSVDDPLLTPCIVKRPREAEPAALVPMEVATSDPDITIVAATPSNVRNEEGTIITLQDSETSGKVHIRLKQQPEQVTIIDNLDNSRMDDRSDDSDYLQPAEFVQMTGTVQRPSQRESQRRENMRRQMVRRAYLAREKAKRRAERARVKRAAIKKAREEEKIKLALAAMEEMMKERDSEDITVRNKPLPPEYRKIKRMLARKGMLPDKVKKKRIDMPYKDKVAEHIAKLSPTEFQCKLCLETFRWNYKCEQHILNHTGERPFKCHICGKSYKENCVLEQHMRMHKDKYLFVCEECGAGFKRRYLLSYHTRRFHGEEVRLLCEDCGKVFHSRETLNAHVRYHHKKKMVVCDICGQVVRHSEIGRHRRKHGPLSSCPLCNRQFRRQDARERHIQEHDNPNLPAHCIACGKYFRGRRSLMEHLDRVHNMEADGCVELKQEPDQDSLPCAEDELEGDEDTRVSHTGEVHLEVHDLLDTDDVGATQQISLGEEDETRAASNVLDEIAATVLLQQ